MEEIVRRLGVPRRTIERSFRETLGRTVYEELTRTHVERAKHFLADTHIPLAEVAKLSGFSDQRMLSVVFKRTTGSTPGQYRRAHHYSTAENGNPGTGAARRRQAE